MTTPATMPDWASLWKREPGLKPDELYPESNPDGFMVGGRYVSDSVAAALCRDAATQYLHSLPQFWYTRTHKGPHAGPYAWSIEVYENRKGATLARADGPDYDTALRNLIDAVLTQQGK